jgi:hypothetical protein
MPTFEDTLAEALDRCSQGERPEIVAAEYPEDGAVIRMDGAISAQAARAPIRRRHPVLQLRPDFPAAKPVVAMGRAELVLRFASQHIDAALA